MKKKLLLLCLLAATIFVHAQNVGIGTTTPLARLHVTDSSVLFSSTGDIPAIPSNTPISGTGRRMMWYPDKAAFRAGTVFGTEWDINNIGNYSFASGYATTASGIISTAMGSNTIASGNYSTAIGYSTTTSGTASTALGFSTTSKAVGSFSTGLFNDISDNPSPFGSFSTDRIFQIGNGSSEATRSNAITILKNGKTGIGTSLPLARLHVIDSSVLFSAPGDIPNTPGNTPISGAGRRMMWYADKSAFRAGTVFGTEWDISNIGNYSFASGYATIASGIISTAMGSNTIANREYATAMGYATTASGAASTSLGFSTSAKAVGSFSTGLFNNITDNPSPSGSAPTDRIFQIGNGNSEATRSNAVTVLKNGNTGIGVNAPLAKLHVADSSVLFSATGVIPVTPGPTPVNGTGRRMMWYADKAAFRVGYAVGTEWDINNIGNYSFASGWGTKASGLSSTAMGTNSTTASGINSTAIGSGTLSSGDGATAIGNFTQASGFISTALGNNTHAKSGFETVIGSFNSDYTPISTTNWSGADRLFVVGNGTDNSNRSDALVILKNGNTGIGVFNPDYVLDVGARMRIRSTPGNTAGIWLNNDANNTTPAFVGMRNDNLVGFYGNGAPNSGWGFLMNTTNGRVGIGTDNPTQALHVVGNICATGTIGACSDFRYKKDFTHLSHALHSVLLLNSFYYKWKKDEYPGMQFTNNRQLGFSAQEVEKLFPEIVMTDANGYKSVDYGRLTPVLVEAIKEQQQQIDELKKLVEKLLKQ